MKPAAKSKSTPAVAEPMGERRTARLFTNGASQAVRLPKEFRMAGKEVRIWKEGDRVVMEPIAAEGETLADVLERFYAACPEGLDLERNQLPMQQRDWDQGLDAGVGESLAIAEPEAALYPAKRKRR